MESLTPTFWQALARREWRSPALMAFAGVLIVLGATAGYGTGSLDARTAAAAQAATSTARFSGVSLATNFLDLSAGVLALLAALLVVERVFEDHDGAWLVGFVALGAPRHAYLLPLYAVITLSVTAAFCGSVLAFALGALIAGRPVWGQVARMCIGGSLNIASLTAYGLAASLLTRSRQAAVVTGVAALALPIMLMMAYAVRADANVPVSVRRLVLLHLPPVSFSTAPRTLAAHVAYTVIILALSASAANRFVVRYR